MPKFIPVSAGLYVNLAQVVAVELGINQDTGAIAVSGDKAALVVWLSDKKAYLARGVFAEGVLREIGADVHAMSASTGTLLGDTTK